MVWASLCQRPRIGPPPAESNEARCEQANDRPAAVRRRLRFDDR